MKKNELEKDSFVGVWENKNIVPFAYDDNLEITFYLSANNTSNIRIQISEDNDKSYFCEGFELTQLENDKFKIIFKNSELNADNDLSFDCRMHIKGQPNAFVIKFLNYGERYFEKI